MTDGSLIRFRSQPRPLRRLVKMTVRQAFSRSNVASRPSGGARYRDATLSSSSHSWKEKGEGRTKGRAEAPPALLAAVLLWSEVVSGPENVRTRDVRGRRAWRLIRPTTTRGTR